MKEKNFLHYGETHGLAPPGRPLFNLPAANAVRLVQFDDNRKAADYLQASFAANDKTAPESFKREAFTTDYREPGVQLSHTGKSPKSATPDLRSHRFITRNPKGQCVSISYITSPTDESAAMLETIRKSIRVE